MIGSISAQVALLAFAIAVLGGLLAGNSPETILLRGLGAMFAALAVAQGTTWTAKLVLRDHLQRRKMEIDCEHLAATAPSGRPARGQAAQTEDQTGAARGQGEPR